MLLYVALVGFATRPKTTDNAIELPDRMTYSGSTTLLQPRVRHKLQQRLQLGHLG